MAEHTKEPWSVHSGDVWQGYPDNPIVPLYRQIRDSNSWRPRLDEEVMDENSRRVAACINACAGIPTEALENLAAGLVLVPSEPTPAMIDAADEICPIARGTESHAMSGGKVPEDYWRVMIEAFFAKAEGQ